MAKTSPLLFAGQVAIVTGGADGLGKAIVAMLVGNGASVAIFDVAEQRMLEYARTLQSQGYKVGTFKVDISQEESVRRGFEAFRKEFDRLDIMVNCAGVVGPNGVKTTEVSVEDFDRVFAGELSIRYVNSIPLDRCIKPQHNLVPCPLAHVGLYSMA